MSDPDGNYLIGFFRGYFEAKPDLLKKMCELLEVPEMDASFCAIQILVVGFSKLVEEGRILPKDMPKIDWEKLRLLKILENYSA